MNLQLTSLDILYLSLSIGFLILVFFIVFLIIRLTQTLESLKMLIEDLDDTASDVRDLKNKIKGGFFGALSSVLGLVLKRR